MPPISHSHYTLTPGRNACGQSGHGTTRLAMASCPHCRAAIEAVCAKIQIIFDRLEISPEFRMHVTDALKGHKINPVTALASLTRITAES